MGLFSRTRSTTAGEVAERLAGRSVVVVDVRQPAEWRRGHIQGSVNVPLGRLPHGLPRLPAHATVVTVCASGHRSAAAARMLARAGREVENLAGGMRAWTKAGLPVSSR
jgi:rhodanese-related sulfurtransferase